MTKEAVKEDTNNGLTRAEIDLYDRQIRLWGVTGQSQLREAHVLVINMSGVCAEVVKNMTLAGIGKVTISDSSIVHEEDLQGSFYLCKDDVGKLRGEAVAARVRQMNDRCNVDVVIRGWRDLNDWEKFDVVVCGGLCGEEMSMVNKLCRDKGVRFIGCGVHGMYGFVFEDLIETRHSIKREKVGRVVGSMVGEGAEIIDVKEVLENDVVLEELLVQCLYKPFSDLNFEKVRSVYGSEKKLRKRVSRKLFWMLGILELEGKYGVSIDEIDVNIEELVGAVNGIAEKFGVGEVFKFDTEELSVLRRHAYCEYAPSNAIIGGVVSQDVVNCIVRKELCVNNFAVLDGDSLEMPVYVI